MHSFLDIFQRSVERGAYRTESSLTLRCSRIPAAREFLEAFESDHSDKHAAEVQRLKALTPEQFKDHDMVTAFRTGRYNIKMCSISYELLVYFLHDKHFTLLINMVNSLLNIQGPHCRAPALHLSDSF